ncbi:LacI family DNA-binding transcriptional regulator [Actinomyces faecalis]|uniref:LacI family DNA-binding transcriptional regulator n=1 Tax=Actinomyces faecalis TaxID=2722820 RepID=UPI0015541907|nr:LacI family DNA-binding transcriptional regulator [Actinomyces faecalis]
MRKLAGERGRRRASMTDVGRRAGVSAQTVSRYFNDGYVSDQARARIEEAVRALGYVPNRLPVQLRRDRTDSIGVCLFGPLNYGNSSIMTGIYRVARELGQRVLMVHMEPDPQGSAALWDEAMAEIDAVIANRVDAIVIASPYEGLMRMVDHVGNLVPVVVLSEFTDSERDPVGSYSYGLSLRLVQHLIALGRTEILHVAGPGDRIQARLRRRAYEDALAEAGLKPLPIVECEEWDAVSAAKAAEHVEVDDFTAVFAGNDDLALGFMSVMRARGVVAPRDYVIAGFDDRPQARFFEPPLTTAHIDFDKIGETAIRTAVARAAGEPESTRQWFVPGEIVLRESTEGF